ncbi:MAG: AAA family ATPase [Ignavibacteriales bacterium]|nr:AAA family ATPase [Ignavibacteriales bacterium]
MALPKSSKYKELLPEELRWTCNPEVFDFESTNTIKPIDGIVGQERAIKALTLGVDLKGPGYNIFITGMSGTGKFTTIKQMLEKIRPQPTKLFDYVYVNNFKDPDYPRLLTFTAGLGLEFKKDMDNAIQFLRENIIQILESEAFNNKRKKLYEKYSEEQQTLMKPFEEKLSQNGFSIGQVKVGEVVRPELLPIIEDKPVFIQQLDDFIKTEKITAEQAEEITQNYEKYQEELQSIFRKNYKLTQKFQKKINELEERIAGELVSITLDDIREKYKIKKVIKHLEQLEQDIIANLNIFKSRPQPGSEDEFEAMFNDYTVNVILNNSSVKERPVIIETTPTYINIFGAIERVNDGGGSWSTDFTKIKSGAILRANGGYLVLNAMDALTEPGVWKTLKRVLLHNKLEIQDIAHVYQIAPSLLKPEPIIVDVKVILIGNEEIYYLLAEYEDDFKKAFKIKAEFDYEMKRTDKALVEYAHVVKKLIKYEELLEFDKSAIARIVEYGARYAENQNKLTTRFSAIADLVREANYWAKDGGEKIVNAYHVQQAIKAAKERFGLDESKIQEMIIDKTILIDTEGERTGQVNGLAVYGDGLYSFGKPTRLTASTSLGNGEIINIDKDAGLSGKTHTKSIHIIGGYFRERFGLKNPLSFKASLVFEQGYGLIDGDSASIAEIAVLISCLTELPIKQNIAVTGSINQKGDVQPIGGVNEKIEGFFDVCKERVLTKKQGVIIPVQNIKDLMLKEEVVEAVRNKEFHIYSVSRVEEAIEILLGYKVGKQLANGSYEKNSVYGMVEKKLHDMYKITQKFKVSGEKKKEQIKTRGGKTRKRKL